MAIANFFGQQLAAKYLKKLVFVVIKTNKGIHSAQQDEAKEILKVVVGWGESGKVILTF